MTVAKLREALKEKGLDTSGLKAALVERLQEALRSGGDAPPVKTSPAPSPKKSPKKRKREASPEKEAPPAEPALDPDIPPPAPAPAPAPAPEPEPAPEPAPAPPPLSADAPVAEPAPAPRAPPFMSDARAAAAAALAKELEDEEDEEDDEAARAADRRERANRASRDCPYLDTVNRAMLDFDFEKCCSVTLSPHNVYACLVCGKYFQGRGPNTQAYTHSLEASHHVFMNLDSGKVYCLPDAYEVVDRSLDDIRHVLDPSFTPDHVAETDVKRHWSRGLDGADYLTGAVGLNNLRATDYVNVVLQSMMRVAPIRDYFLSRRELGAPGGGGPVTRRFGELTRKIWNWRNFKGQVSPHEFMQAVLAGSNRRFLVDKQSDPVDFLTWFLHAAHRELGGKSKGARSVIDRCFQGELEVTTVEDGKAPAPPQRMPFYALPLDLPAAPLFQDAMEKNAIPQVPIGRLLRKFDGETEHETVRGGRRTFKLARLPRFLIVHHKRFTKNNFFLEKNPTIVNFPVRNLRLSDHVPVPEGPDGRPAPCVYDLVANVSHDGKPEDGAYRAMVFHKADGNWYEVCDLSVAEVLPQQVALAETYAQIYELRPPERTATGTAAGVARMEM